MQILEISESKKLAKVMRDIKVDSCGIKIMVPKAITHLLRINAISNISANILKQEMLSLGGDAAVARDALTGRTKTTDCLLIGNLAQLVRLKEKLKTQPFGLNRLAGELSEVIDSYNKDKFILRAGKHALNLSRRAHIMGIINMTPDSFSGDGIYKSPSQQSIKSEVSELAEQMVKDGADIIDVGGESSRPGARPVSVKEELNRVIPVIKALAKKISSPISIDTYKPQVARAALDAGAVIVNDISGLRNTELAGMIARYKAAVVIMHMKGNPFNMQKNPVYVSLIDEIISYLKQRLLVARDSGITADRIMIDPGLGFGKTLEHNLEILQRLGEFKVLGSPVLVGPSRKSFIGKILGVECQDRIFGTVSACVLAVKNGAQVVRVHDVLEAKQALKVFDAVERV